MHVQGCQLSRHKSIFSRSEKTEKVTFDMKQSLSFQILYILLGNSNNIQTSVQVAPIISSSLLLVNKHKWTLKGMLRDTVQLSKMYYVSFNRSISVSTAESGQ